jgi:hypothetical protein
MGTKLVSVPSRALHGIHHPALSIESVARTDDHLNSDRESIEETQSSPPNTGAAVQLGSGSACSSGHHPGHTNSMSDPGSMLQSHSQSHSRELSHVSTNPRLGRDEDLLVPLWMHLLLTTVGADSMGRSKLTGWQVPACNHNGGWCGCISRGQTRVCSTSVSS